MDVVMLSAHYAPHIGGVEKHVAEVTRRLAARGHRVYVYTRRHEWGSPVEEVVKGVRVVRLGAPGTFGKYTFWANLLAYRSTFAAADVIHCHDYYVFVWWLMPFLWVTGIQKPLFVTFHGYEGYPLRKKDIWLRRWVAKRALGSIAVGHYIEKWYGTKHNLVTYGGVDVSIGAGGSRRSILPSVADAVFVGRLAFDTGIMDYLRALVELRNRGIDLSLDVYGDGPLRRDVLGYSNRWGLNVRLHGMVENAADFIAGHRVAFVSSYLAILERLASGVPVIAVYDNPLKYDYLALMPDSTRYLSICSGPREIADAVIRHLNDLSWSTAMVHAGLEHVSLFTWEGVTQLYLILYQEAGVSGSLPEIEPGLP